MQEFELTAFTCSSFCSLFSYVHAHRAHRVTFTPTPEISPNFRHVVRPGHAGSSTQLKHSGGWDYFCSTTPYSTTHHSTHCLEYLVHYLLFQLLSTTYVHNICSQLCSQPLFTTFVYNFCQKLWLRYFFNNFSSSSVSGFCLQIAHTFYNICSQLLFVAFVNKHS